MPKGYETISTFNPQQQQGFSQLIQMLMGQLGGGQGLFGQGSNYLQNLLSGSPEAFSNFEAPFKRQFEQETVPGIAERFSGLGSGAQSSSAFQQALGQAGAGLSENLASLRSGLQMQALPFAQSYSQQPMNALQNLLGMNTQSYLPKQQPFWKELLLGLAPGLGSAAGGWGLGKLGR